MAREDVSLLEVLREDLDARSVKDGCSPQGQCGCCTVLIDGAARVACVTPVRRVAGRNVVTVEGLDPPRRDRLVASFLSTGAAQCGFCTPGILTRLSALPEAAGPAQVETALLAHLCRCTGWRSIVAAAAGPDESRPAAGAAAARAALEGGTGQESGPGICLGRAGFADDTAPADSLVAVPRAGTRRSDLADPSAWATGSTLAEARVAAGKVQGRRSGLSPEWPVAVPEGEWAVTLQTTWVEPAYLETDASWCRPGEQPASPVANGGAFGAKLDSPAPPAARLLADLLGRPVRTVLSREDSVRLGSKRPPAAGGAGLDGRGALVLLHPGPPPAAMVAGIAVETVGKTVAGADPALATSLTIRGAGFAEAHVLTAAAAALASGRQPDPGQRPPDGTGRATVRSDRGAVAEAHVEVDAGGWPTAVSVALEAGDPLDTVTLRSYAQGAAHMALGWVCSEGLATDESGWPTDLTIRSFGILRARDTPPIEVTLTSTQGPPVAASDAVFAAVAAATWLAQGLPSRWPTMRGSRR